MPDPVPDNEINVTPDDLFTFIGKMYVKLEVAALKLAQKQRELDEARTQIPQSLASDQPVAPTVPTE